MNEENGITVHGNAEVVVPIAMEIAKTLGGQFVSEQVTFNE
jgi:hypothetical protein